MAAKKLDCPPCPPCAPTSAAAAALSGPRTSVKVPASAKPFRPAALSLSTKGVAVQTESIQHGNIIPVPSYSIRGCCTKPPRGKTCNQPPRLGQVDLVFPSRKDAEKHKVPLGPALQFCTGTREGKIVPMKDPFTAKRVAMAYIACINQGSTTDVCIMETKSLGALRAREKSVSRRGLRRAPRRVGRLGRRR